MGGRIVTYTTNYPWLFLKLKKLVHNVCMNSHFDPDEEAPLDVDLDVPFMEKTPFPLRVAVTVTRGRFNGITARGGAGTRLW